MRFPAGDDGIIDDCSGAMEGNWKIFDQEVAPARIMNGKPVGVTVPRASPRVLKATPWDMGYMVTIDPDDISAPLPFPERRSPTTSPRGIECSTPDSCQGGQTWSALSEYNYSTGPNAVPQYDGGHHLLPAPTSPDRPGTELARTDCYTPRLEEPMLVTPRRDEDDLQFQDSSDLIILPEPVVLPVPVEPEFPDVAAQRSRTPPPLSMQNDIPDVAHHGRWAQPKMKMRKTVSFSQLDTMSYDVTPYSEVYGDHPKNFHFDAEGNKVSPMSPMKERSMLSIASWGFEQRSFGMGFFDRGFEEYHESEPLYG
jgi:hypothetical protein